MATRKVSQAQYQKARKIIDLATKENEEWRSTRLLPIIKKFTETYWKKKDSSSDGHYYYIRQHDNHTLHVISFVSRKNGQVEIRKHWLDGARINEFLGEIVKREAFDDEEGESCNCPQIVHSHFREQHTPLTRITKKNFEKNVKAKVLNELRIGLDFV
jgi:hypothetical protein